MIYITSSTRTNFYADMGEIEVKEGKVHITSRNFTTLNLDCCFSVKEIPQTAQIVDGFQTNFNRLICRDGICHWV